MSFKTHCRFLLVWEKHDWGRWEEPQNIPMVLTRTHHGKVVSESPYTRTFQQRKCKNCFKLEQNILCD